MGWELVWIRDVFSVWSPAWCGNPLQNNLWQSLGPCTQGVMTAGSRFYAIAGYYSVMLSELALGDCVYYSFYSITQGCAGLCSNVFVIWMHLQRSLVAHQLSLLYGSLEWECSKDGFKNISISVSPKRIYKSSPFPFFWLFFFNVETFKEPWIWIHNICFHKILFSS